MPPTHAARPRLITGAVAMTGALAIAVVTQTDRGRLAGVASALSVVAIATLLVGLLGGWRTPAVASAALLGAGFLFTRYGDAGAVDVRVVPVAVALLLVAEFGAWSAELRTVGYGGASPAARAYRLAIVGIAAAAVAFVLTAVAQARPVTDLANAALGVASLALLAATLTALTRAARPR